MAFQDISFDISSGPVMTGTWVNPKNGDIFEVRDTVFEDNQLMVQTVDGRYLDYNFIQNYVKCSPAEAKSIKESALAKQKSSTTPSIPKLSEPLEGPSEPAGGNEWDEYMIPDDKVVGERRVNLDKPLNTPTHNNIFNRPVESEDSMFIRRALGKTKGPEIKVSITWPNYPEEKIDMLTTLLDVSFESIAEWYLKDVDVNSIKKEVSNAIVNYLSVGEDKKKSTKSEVVVEKADKKEKIVEKSKGRPKKTTK